ncbi:MAG TPA: hypothetical protein VN836_00935 [Verrucomicrobiae bacterium]|nr:hypothetical protein [Verrucomicrobiae bacterium]
MKYFAIGIGLVFLFLQTSCSTQRAIWSYSGDGEILAMPDGGFWQGGGGYEVRFPHLKLDHPVKVTYHFTGLPKTGWFVQVYFAIDGPQVWRWRNEGDYDATKDQNNLIDNLNGTLAMSLKDAEGHVILGFQHKLSEFTWCRGSGPPCLYDFSKFGFKTDRREGYTLEVTINPDATLKDDEGYVLLRSGGHEGISL